MALTIEKIHAAADQIAAQGERPTLNRVRAALGGGSFSTISEAMQEWREQQSKEYALAEVQVPEAVAERVQQLQSAAWQAAMEEAERRLTAEREALHEVQEQAVGEVAEAREAVQTLEAEAEERDRELVTLRNKLADAEAVAKDAIAARQQADQQRDADAARLGERIEGLEARLADAVEARKAAAQDAKATGKTLEEVRHKLGEVERAAATAEARAQERADSLRAEQEARQAAEARAQERADSLRAEQEARQAAEAALADERQRYERERKAWRQELDALQVAAAEAVQLRERVAGLEARLVDANQLIERLTTRGEHGTGSEDDQPSLPLT